MCDGTAHHGMATTQSYSHCRIGWAANSDLQRRVFSESSAHARFSSQRVYATDCRAKRAVFLAAMVQARMGVAILPEPICQRLDKGKLLWLPLESDLIWKLGLIWREGSYLSKSAQAWIACYREFWPGETSTLKHLKTHSP